MINDDHLIFENYMSSYNKSNEGSSCKYAEEGCDCDGCVDCKANQKSEDAESTGDDIMHRIEQKRKARKNIGSVRTKSEDNENIEISDGAIVDDESSDEDAETYGVEGKIQAALHEVESFGYTGDHIDPIEIARLVVGSQSDWGDSYEPLVQALGHVIGAYYERGLQDS